MENRMEMKFTARDENEALARVAAASFLMIVDPTLEEIADIKTAISEAVTNSIIHGYGNGEDKGIVNESAEVIMRCYLQEQLFTVEIEDYGCGIQDVEKAMEPLYTTRPDMERSGMGFSFMQAFMDMVQVESKWGVGTKVTMQKHFGKENQSFKE